MTMSNTKTLTLADLTDKSIDDLHAHILEEYGADSTKFNIVIAYESVGGFGCDSASYWLLERYGKWYEVHGSHCSCHGFEGQFEPKPVSPAYLRSKHWSISCGSYDDEWTSNFGAIKSRIGSIA
jgi:hypothetical protein